MAGALAALVHTPGELASASRKLLTAVASSFATNGGRQTQNEIRRRSQIAIKAFEVCRSDLHFSVTRSCDEMLLAILANLGDFAWEPQMGQSWAAPNTVLLPMGKTLGMHKLPD